MKKTVILILAAALLLTALPTAGVRALDADPVLKIGLFYNLNALPAANLQNATGYGKGYDFGYFDANRNFVPLYGTDEVYLTILKDKPMYMKADRTYYDVAPAEYSITIGPYHVELAQDYWAIADAAAVASQITASGIKAFPAYVGNGVFRVRAGEYMTAQSAQDAIANFTAVTGYAARVAGMSPTCYTVTITGTFTVLFEFDAGVPFGIMPRGLDGAPSQTWFKGNKYYGGFEYNRVNGNDITVINVVTMQNYLKGVIPYEMSPSWPIEALKAQTICAKSYAVTNLNKHKSLGFDLCNTTDCQVYYGTGSASANSDRAVDETFGMYVTYNGSIAQTYYHSSSGGYTENSEYIWGTAVPYLKAVEDKYLVKTLPWNYTVTPSAITAILKSKGYNVTNVVDYYVSSYTPSGNVRQVTFLQSSGSPIVVSGEKARTVLNSSAYGVSTQSHRYAVGVKLALWINNLLVQKPLHQLFAIGRSGKAEPIMLGHSELRVITKNGVESVSIPDVVFQVDGTGSGHNIGMSQWGAHAMAQLGFTYDQIIKFYFTGVQVGPAN